MDEMLKKQDVIDAIMAKIDELNKKDASADVILGLAAAMSVVKKMEGEDAEVLDKIKAEIETKCCITVGRENDGAITLHDVFEIIDKYKAEK